MAEGMQIFRITVSSRTEALIDRYDSIGIGDIISDIAKESVAGLTLLGLKALQSTVPFKTGELRNDHIERYLGNPMDATVFIDGFVHEATSGKDKPDADELADILNVPREDGTDWIRRADSQPEDDFEGRGAGSATTGWIENALEQYDEREERVLNGKA